MSSFDLDSFSARLHAESDRACAVLGGALLDAKLEELFKRRLSCFHKELLQSMGPLGSFAARTRLARALNWINDDAQFDLDTVRRIRNDFAHSFDHTLSFDDQSVAARCVKLRTAQAIIDGFDLAAVAPDQNLSSQAVYEMQAVFKPPRWRFQHTVAFVAQYLDDISGGLSSYTGVDLVAEARALSARMRVRGSGTGSAVSPISQPSGTPES